MEYRISDLLDGTEFPAVELREQNIPTERVKALTMGRIEKKSRRKFIRRPAFAVLAAVLCVLVGVAALADGTGFFRGQEGQSASDFFSGIFGTAVSGHEAYTRRFDVDGQEKVESYPAFERVEVDSDKAQELIGDSVQEINESAVIGDFTVTVYRFAVDENGVGALSYAVSNPNGINDMERDTDKPYIWLDLQTASGKMADVMDYRLEGGSETSASYVCYFAPFYPDAGEGYVLTFRMRDGESRESVSLELNAESRVKASVFSDKNTAVSVSPIGMTVTADANEDRVIQKLVIRYESGEEYTVTDGESHNISVEALNEEDGSLALAFNRLVDVEAIREIILTANGQEYRLK